MMFGNTIYNYFIYITKHKMTTLLDHYKKLNIINFEGIVKVYRNRLN